MQSSKRTLPCAWRPRTAKTSGNVYGRGILHLSVLIETMRREGYELQIGKPQVLFKEVDGARHEPFEHLVIDVPEATAGKATELVMMRKGMLQVMEAKEICSTWNSESRRGDSLACGTKC